EKLKWETTAQYNVGLDMGLLNDRISLVVDAYHKKTTDLLLNVDLPTTTGYTRALQNIGSIQNKGLEFTLNTVNTTGPLKWTSNFNISFNRSKVLDLGENTRQLYSYAVSQNVNNNILVQTGHPIGVYFGYIGDGVYNTLAEVEHSPENKVIPKTGRDLLGEMKFVDVNADGVIDDSDRVPLAYTEPNYIGGFVNNLAYKGFDMSIVMRWSYGNDIVNGNIGELNNLSPYTNNLVSNYENMWLPWRAESNYTGFNRNGRGGFMHSEYIEDGSFLRVDRIALGYTFPQAITRLMKVNTMRVYVNVRNVLLLTRYSWYDPEVSTGSSTSVAKLGPGADLGAYPRTRQFQFGLNISL
ncbi:MAG TPA: TonB-dependent receptor, partial [Sphingobacterium sp.]|nr:TonB-dependent receptor [Sphingobacterium sp.]